MNTTCLLPRCPSFTVLRVHLLFTKLFLTRMLLAGLLVAMPVGTVSADNSDERIGEALKLTTDAAKRYQFEITGESPRELKFHRKSLLRWSNPVAGELYGNVFVWTDQGRPEVIGSVLQWYSPMTHGSHEFHSLSLEPLRGMRDDQDVWTSAQPGIELQSVPQAPPVAESKFLRLRHLRAIARDFAVRKTDREDVTRELRLLPQPIFRYGNDNAAVLDGALFVFVQGTDPEVFLMVEAREVGGRWKWHYALARMNSIRFVVTHRGSEVWETEIWPWRKVKNGREVYTHYGPFDGANLRARPVAE